MKCSAKWAETEQGGKPLGGRVFLSQLCSQFQERFGFRRPGCFDPDADAGQESPAEEMGRVDEKGWGRERLESRGRERVIFTQSPRSLQFGSVLPLSSFYMGMMLQE